MVFVKIAPSKKKIDSGNSSSGGHFDGYVVHGVAVGMVGLFAYENTRIRLAPDRQEKVG